METIEQLKEELEKAQKLTKELEEKIKDYKRKDRADFDSRYYVISDDGFVHTFYESNDNFDDRHYDIGNYFLNKGDAERVCDKIRIYKKLKNLADRLNMGMDFDWNDFHQTKFSIILNNHNLSIDVHWTHKEIGVIYCLDCNFLDKAKEEIGEEYLKFMFDEE